MRMRVYVEGFQLVMNYNLDIDQYQMKMTDMAILHHQMDRYFQYKVQAGKGNILIHS